MPKNIQQLFGARIAELRRRQGWTQEKLSEYTNISTEHISYLENGHREPCLGVMVKLAKAFDISLSELVAGVDLGKSTSF